MGYWTGEINEGRDRKSRWEGGVSKGGSPYNGVMERVYLIILGIVRITQKPSRNPIAQYRSKQGW